MIIYTKKDAAIIIPCGLGPSVCPDVSHDLQTKTVDSSTVLQQVKPDSGYYGLSSVTVEPYTLDSKTVNSSTAQQVITSSVDGLSSVTVEPYTLDSKTVNSSTAQQVITSDKDGLSSVTVEPYVLDSKTVNPSTSQQTVTSSADGLSSVTVNAVTSSIDPDIQAGNIKRGVEILGVTGTFDGGSLQSKEVNSSTNSQSVTPDSGYYGLSGVTVNPYTLESKAQTITLNGTYSFIPTSADGLSSVDISVNVLDIPAVVQSKSVTYTENGEYTVTPDQGYDGLSSVDISVNIPPEPVVLQSKTVKSSTESQSVTYDSGFDGLSSVTVEPYTLDSKTVNSSTAQQVITSSVDGLSSVTVNPYTLDSKTVDPSTSQITVNSSADGLSSVTVNAVTSSIDANISSSNIKRGVEILGVTGTFDGGSLGTKTVNSSTSTQTITPEPGDYGLSSVTVNPYTLDTKTVNSSTAQQVITSGKDGLSSVTVNPYTVEADSSTLTANGTYTFTPTNADALSSVTVDVSVNAQDWYTAWKLGNKVDFSDVDLSQVMELESGLNSTFIRGVNEDMITAPPKLGGTILRARSMYQTFVNTTFSSDKGGVTISFPNLVSIEGSLAMYECFYGVTNVKKLMFPKLTSVSGIQAMYNMFSCYGSGAQLTEIYMPKLQTIGDDSGIFGAWIDDPTGASRRLVIHVDALKSNAEMWNPTYAMGNSLTYIEVRGKASNSIYLTNNPNLDAGAVYSVLESMLGTSGTGKSCNFASSGLTVTDVANGKLRSTYNDCVSQGWTINNLTILPYSNS